MLVRQIHIRRQHTQQDVNARLWHGKCNCGTPSSSSWISSLQKSAEVFVPIEGTRLYYYPEY